MQRDVLARLAALEPAPLPFLSAYIDLTPAYEIEHPDVDKPRNPPYRSERPSNPEREPRRMLRQGITQMRDQLREKSQLFDVRGMERESYDADMEKILGYLDRDYDVASRGVAIFACYAADIFEVVELSVAVETQLFVDRQPCLSPLAMLLDNYARYAVAAVKGDMAHIYVIGTGSVEYDEIINGQTFNRTEKGGWSQSRYQRRADNAANTNVREAMQRLEEIVLGEDIPFVILAGNTSAQEWLRQNLSEQLAPRVIQMTALDPNTPADEAVRQTIDKIFEAEEQESRDLAKEAIDLTLANGLGAAGPEAVAHALRLGAVHILVMDENFHAEGFRSADEPGLIAGGEHAPRELTALGEVEKTDLREEMVTLATQTGAQIEFATGHPVLERAGGVAALLRWRPDDLPRPSRFTRGLAEAAKQYDHTHEGNEAPDPNADLPAFAR